ncbi:sigma-54-dependent Fis family transcriptional regulator [Nocardia mexicana]|uniref:Transcriptional regulator of acetoin/glycerol metabolism n=1 Tax=Nocardia mexicana TaxID=279262 RepID=A0A370HFH2_9NOCA|nr:helix-turn-helix domain-containing protein [Nocardia mexicana]RDI55987.1 transcriptional regulator of acetoin/glycerol metabolism [Nocardia mexicana]
MTSVSPQCDVEPTRSEIASSWTRSRLNGLREDALPRLVREAIVPGGALARAAHPVLRRMADELEGTTVALVLADNSARVVDVQAADPAVGRGIAELGLAPGVRLGEEEVGTNAVGTPVETRRDVLVRGPEHYLTAFRSFTCYGHPIIHPTTRRLAGVLDIGGPASGPDSLFRPLARGMVRDIQERLRHDSTRDQRLLFDAFQAAGHPRGRPVMVVGQGLVLATPAALDLLDPADHAAVRTCAEEAGFASGQLRRLTLVSGRSVVLSCTPIDGVDGSLVDIVSDDAFRSGTGAGVTARWPLLVIGEIGSGRSTEAYRAAGADAIVLDATEVVRQGERAWATAVAMLLEQDGPAVVVENIQLLSERLSTLLAQCLREARRHIVLTSTPDHSEGVHAPLAAMCNARRTLLPLRRRRHEIPYLAQRMLADLDGTDRLRFTADALRVLAAQPWPGNLAELHRVVRSVAEVRSAGDIIPSDLPASYRGGPAPGSPLREAEREVIVAAIEAAGGNKLRAARALGVSRSTLYNRMRALHIG